MPCQVHYQPGLALDPWPAPGAYQPITANCRDCVVPLASATWVPAPDLRGPVGVGRG